MCFYFTKPSFYTRVRIFTCDIITEENNISTSIENTSDWTERLLARCVPNLELGDSLIQLDDKRTKLYSNGNLVLKFKIFIHHSWEEATLTNAYDPVNKSYWLTSVTDYNEFKQVILSV